MTVKGVFNLVQVGERLLDVADSECIRPETHRAAIAGASVYAADRLTDGKSLTQADVIEAASTIVPTSLHQVRTYSGELYDAAKTRNEPIDAVAGLVQAD